MKTPLRICVLFAIIISGCSKSTSLTDCPDCGEMVSMRASDCPHCGGPLPQDVTLNIADRSIPYVSEFDPDGNPVKLSYSDDALTTADIEGITRLSTVRAVWFFKNTIDPYTSLAPLETNKSIICLHFSGEVSLSADQFRSIAKMPNLTTLHLWGCIFDPQDLKELSNSESLQYIWIKASDLSNRDQGIKIELDSRTLSELSHLPSLIHLQLRDFIFPSDWVTAFTDGFKNIAQVDLPNCNLSDEDVREMLKERVRKNHGGIDWSHNWRYLVPHESRLAQTDYEWPSDIIEADVKGHFNWWAWILAVIVAGGGYWRFKLKRKNNDLTDVVILADFCTPKEEFDSEG